MFSENLVKSQPFVSKFFETAINSTNSKFANAYLFTGSNLYEQYFLALQLAKELNCTKPELNNSNDCTCTNCNWIDKNRHPAVITISPVDFTFDIDGNKTAGATLIKVDQTRYLRKVLSVSSNYHRVIIFTDATENSDQSANDIALNNRYKNLISSPQNDSVEERAFWAPLPLTYKVFQNETANTLLKTIEEPGANITFFFLTRDKADVLDTIVSRCQVLPVSSGKIVEPQIVLPDNFESIFPPKDFSSALFLSEKFVDFSKQNSISVNTLLDYLQEYLRRLIKCNSSDLRLVLIFIEYFSKVEDAKQRLTSYVSPNAVLDSLFLSFVK